MCFLLLLLLLKCNLGPAVSAVKGEFEPLRPNKSFFLHEFSDTVLYSFSVSRNNKIIQEYFLHLKHEKHTEAAEQHYVIYCFKNTNKATKNRLIYRITEK